MNDNRDRQTEEPPGRWENRCPFTWRIDGDKWLICDRPREHAGLHRGRLMLFPWPGGDASVLGYGARR